MYVYIVKVKVFVSHLVVSYSLHTHGLQPYPLCMEYFRQEYWNGLPFSSLGIPLTQGWNPGLPHCRQTLYLLSEPQGLPHVYISGC